MRMRHWICAAALSGGLLIGGVAAFSAYATSVETVSYTHLME